ncbi:glycosyltransferase family 2 protein [uncultured Xylophilus sp.]|uniref:glycosyltransferase family 2 protein n=1 Tax=uncultured Xylophilus sp. TaxID=296832 RepID=UPI0025D6D182|nr:glycosyltransferase family 2 protein [uncultured Xylophilus sp.]
MAEGPDAPQVVAIVVSYQPDLSRLEMLLEALTPQVDGIVIVDNGSAVDVAGWHRALAPRGNSHTVVGLGANRGIAAAQNAGIAWAREHAATHVLLMDQDSIPPPGMVAALYAVLQVQTDAAAAGPQYVDARQGRPAPFIRREGLRLLRLECDVGSAPARADYLIASGCLIPMPVIDAVGAMREDLFIDYVDIEWGLRARAHGWQSYGVYTTRMHHELGDPPVRFFGRMLPMHSPLRHYYHVRNAVLLYRERWVPLGWKLVDGWRLLLKFGFYSLVPPRRGSHCRMMALGLWHGLRGRSGPWTKR